MADKTILVIGGGLEAVEGIAQLKADGFFVAVCDGNDEAPGFGPADAAIVASIYHAEQCVPAIAEFHRNVRAIDGLIVLACDAPHVGARVAAAIDIPGLPVAVADRMVDKLAMKEQLQACGIAVPDFSSIKDLASLNALVGKWGKIVVKPVDSRGSKGVSVLDHTGDAAWAFDHAKAQSPSGRVMAERFVEGRQLSTESLVVDGVAHTIGLADRNYEFMARYAPFVIENGGDLPSDLPSATLDRVCDVLNAASVALELHSGPVKGDLVIDDKGGVFVIELAARLSGGHLCTFEIPFSTGVELVTLAGRLATGQAVTASDLAPRSNKSVCIRLLFPEQEGELKKVSGLAAASGSEGVLKMLVWAVEGMQCKLPTNSGGSLGMVITTADNRLEAQARAQKALDRIQLDIR